MKKYLFVCCLGVYQILFAKTDDNENQDSITISSAYFEGQYTNEQLANFGLEILRGGSRLEKYATSSVDPDNAIYVKSLSWLVRLWWHYAFNAAYHEIGHGLRAKAYGADYMLSTDNSYNTFKKDENFFKFFGKKMFNFSRPSCGYSQRLTNKEGLVVAAGGMNNEMYFSERLSDELHKKGEMGVVESLVYFCNRLSPAIYSSKSKSKKDADRPDIECSDDPIAVSGYYRELGISANKNDIKTAGIISTLLSGTTYSILYGTYKSFSTGDIYCAQPLKFAGFRIPDTFSYVTSKGVSYKVVSGYEMQQDLKFIFGIESVFHGKSANEFNLGIEKSFESLLNTSCRLVTTFGKGFNIEASCSIPFTKYLSINFGGGSYSCDSLLGERHAKNMKNDKSRSYNIFVSASYRY